MRLYDSICEGQTYDFNGRPLTYSGLFFDTLQRIGTDCDSLIQLRLAVLEKPDLETYIINSCREPYGYTIESFSYYTPYRRWTASPPDSTLLGQEGNENIFVNPSQPTQYTIYADYRESPPQCPGTNSVSVIPIQPVVAGLRCYPGTLDYDHLTLAAEDYSVGNRTAPYGGWAGRNWYINGIRQPEKDSLARFEAQPEWGDIVNVKIEAYSYTCLDSAEKNVQFHRIALFFPNAFTPQADRNNLFRPLLQGITEYEIWIYRRTGQLVFHTSDPLQGWDGTYQGAPCPQGSYTYRCRYRDTLTPLGNKYQIGTLLLLR